MLLTKQLFSTHNLQLKTILQIQRQNHRYFSINNNSSPPPPNWGKNTAVVGLGIGIIFSSVLYFTGKESNKYRKFNIAEVDEMYGEE